MKRNILLLYILSSLGSMWMWLAVWTLYYLLFTDYAGIGLLESITFFTIVALEIPSGALADIFGKRRTLITAFLFFALGNLIIGFASGIWMLVLGVLGIAFGFSFVSGAFEAIMYDSLKVQGKEKEYTRVYARHKAISLTTFVFAAFIGGYMYQYMDPGTPFIATGLVYIIAMGVALFLEEPIVMNEKTETVGFWEQNTKGFYELFLNSKKTRGLIVMFLLISIIPVFMYEALAELLLIEKGATAQQMGIIIPLVLLASACASYIFGYLYRKDNVMIFYIGASGLYAILVLVSGLVGLWGFVLINLFFAAITTVRWIIESDEINKNITSENRATALSTFSMIKNIPYALLVIVAGYVANIITIEKVVFYMGIMMTVFLLVGVGYWRYSCQKKT